MKKNVAISGTNLALYAQRYGTTLIAGVLFLLACDGAIASNGDELGDGICQVVQVLTGKFLFGISIVAMLAGGAALLFGAEITDGVKKAITIITIVGLILAFGGILAFAFQRFGGSAC